MNTTNDAFLQETHRPGKLVESRADSCQMNATSSFFQNGDMLQLLEDSKNRDATNLGSSLQGNSAAENLITIKLFVESVKEVESLFSKFAEPLLQQEIELLEFEEKLEKLHESYSEYSKTLRSKHSIIVENIKSYLTTLTNETI